jgi:hypothetical protein
MDNEEFENMFESDMGPLFELATALHQMYLNLRTAGFTENQALYLTSKMIIKQNDIDIQMEGE